MTPDPEAQVFRYPSLRHLNWGVWYLHLYCLWILYRLVTTPVSLDFWLYLASSMCFVPALVMSWEAKKNKTGRIEVTNTHLIRHFGDNTEVTLAWNDIIYSLAKPPFRNQWIHLTSESGKHGFYIPRSIERFGELEDIIRSRATQHYKDVKRGKIFVS